MLGVTWNDSSEIHCNSVAQMNCMHTNLLPIPGTKIKYVSALLHSDGENVILFCIMGNGALRVGT